LKRDVHNSILQGEKLTPTFREGKTDIYQAPLFPPPITNSLGGEKVSYKDGRKCERKFESISKISLGRPAEKKFRRQEEKDREGEPGLLRSLPPPRRS